MVFRPNSELVSVEFLRSITGDLGPNFIVGTTMPEKLDSWKNGFVQVAVVGGTPHAYVPTAVPVIQVDCWVPAINSSKPQWGRANVIAETIRERLYDDSTFNQVVEITSGTYSPALVAAAIMLTEPRRVNDDPAGHARFTFDIQVSWVAVAEAV